MTVRELTFKADSEEIAEWISYLEMEDPETPAWQRAAVIAHTVSSSIRALAMNKAPVKTKIRDFMPIKKERFQTTNEQIDMLKALTGGKKTETRS